MENSMLMHAVGYTPSRKEVIELFGRIPTLTHEDVSDKASLKAITDSLDGIDFRVMELSPNRVMLLIHPENAGVYGDIRSSVIATNAGIARRQGALNQTGVVETEFPYDCNCKVEFDFCRCHWEGHWLTAFCLVWEDIHCFHELVAAISRGVDSYLNN